MSCIFTHSKIDKVVAVLIAVGLVILSVFLPQLHGVNGAALQSPLPTDSPLPTPTPLPPPEITIIDPTHGSARQSVRLTISGAHFTAIPVVMLGLTKLTNVEFVSSSIVRTTIPDGMAPGTYTLRLCNPDMQCAEKVDAYTVEANWQPVLLQISPVSGPSNMSNEVTLFGSDMQPGIQISIGNALLQDIVWLNPMVVHAVAPSGLTVGTYDVIARNPGTTEPSILHNAYSVIDQNSDDFFAGPNDLWTWPLSIHEGDSAQIGLVVHRNGGATAQQVQVSFYAGNPMSGGTLLGTATTPPIQPGTGNLEVVYVPWNTAGYSATTDIYAVIDPSGLVNDANRVNNTVTRAITIMPIQHDVLPPRVVTMSIDGGAKVTHNPVVTITLVATDTGGSGVQTMYLVDRIYNAAVHQWVAVQSTGWIPYRETFTMTLINHGGVHYLQAWVADGQGNISTNFALRRIDYIRKSEHIRGGDVHLYQRQLTKGGTFTVHMDSLIGDADLYVWGPGGLSSWVSLNSDQTPDDVTFIVPESGAYSVEVYGYQNSDYDLQISSDGVVGRLAAAATAPARPFGKTQRSAPVTAPESTPIDQVAVPSAPSVFNVFLPMVQTPATPQIFMTFLPFVGNNTGNSYQTFIPFVNNGAGQ